MERVDTQIGSIPLDALNIQTLVEWLPNNRHMSRVYTLNREMRTPEGEVVGRVGDMVRAERSDNALRPAGFEREEGFAFTKKGLIKISDLTVRDMAEDLPNCCKIMTRWYTASGEMVREDGWITALRALVVGVATGTLGA